LPVIRHEQKATDSLRGLSFLGAGFHTCKYLFLSAVGTNLKAGGFNVIAVEQASEPASLDGKLRGFGP